MRRMFCLVISVGMLAGCSSGEVPDAEPKVVDTMCQVSSIQTIEPSLEITTTRFGYQRLVYDDGTSEYLLDENGDRIRCE